MELSITNFLQQSAAFLQLSPLLTPMSDIDQLINDAQNDVPSDQFIPTPAMDSASMFVKPGSTKIITGESDKGVWGMYTSRVVVDEPTAREATNLEQPTAQIRFFLDLAEGSTKEKPILAKGANRNTKLGSLLKATGNDKQGWKYADIENVPFKGKVAHKADNRNPERMNAEVVAFTRS